MVQWTLMHEVCFWSGGWDAAAARDPGRSLRHFSPITGDAPVQVGDDVCCSSETATDADRLLEKVYTSL
jgi:hypothetical protein